MSCAIINAFSGCGRPKAQTQRGVSVQAAGTRCLCSAQVSILGWVPSVASIAPRQENRLGGGQREEQNLATEGGEGGSAVMARRVCQQGSGVCRRKPWAQESTNPMEAEEINLAPLERALQSRPQAISDPETACERWAPVGWA